MIRNEEAKPTSIEPTSIELTSIEPSLMAPASSKTVSTTVVPPKLSVPVLCSRLSFRQPRPRRLGPLLLSVIAGAALLAILANGLLMVSGLADPQTAIAIAV
jgi:hypothetical protein